MKDQITDFVKDYVRNYPAKTEWRTPLVGFAEVKGDYLSNIHQIIISEHADPQQVLPDAETVIAFFLPFTKELCEGNAMPGPESTEWAVAYEETNNLIHDLSVAIVRFLEEHGWRGALPEQYTIYEEDVLRARWSHRHMAAAAGLGTFGVNQMLITEKGCCGRYGSVVTNLRVDWNKPLQEELCLYKRGMGCLKCVEVCPAGALSTDGFNRFMCNEALYRNKELYDSEVHVYDDLVPEETELCGKCSSGMPCSLHAPV